VFEYGRVGKLAGADPGQDLLLPSGRPLSYLRVGEQPGKSRGLTRALLEHRATELRVRIPVVVPPEGSAEIVKALQRLAVSQVFPVLEGTTGEDEVDLCWLDLVQVAALRRKQDTGLAQREVPAAAAGISFSPIYEVSGQPETATRFWQYWNSDWEFENRPEDRDDWWRVRPNERRRGGHSLLPGSRGPEARGTFAACLHPEMKEELGDPPYVVIEHPHRRGYVPALVLEDDGLRKLPESKWRKTIFLDRTARDALGLLDGEFCIVHPWRYPRRTLQRRRFFERLVGARTIAAHVRAPARADLEKPVCRLEPEVLETIGGRGGESVEIERIAKPENALPGHWDIVRATQRVLPIDRDERVRRTTWEAPQTWDFENPNQKDEGSPELTGYVDCAERLGLYPPYPAIYLNYYTRKEALSGLGLCEPVQVRVKFWSRLAAEASEFVWLAVIALLGAAIAFLDSPLWQATAAGMLIALTAALLIFRAIRAVR
jgi:hypothetical protein